jgi:2-phosphoglycerate kinase
MAIHRLDWTVLLVGGPSGAGKSTAAEQLGRRFGISWLQVDDLRLALQRSRVTLPEGTAALYFFVQTPDVWQLPPARLRDGLIAVGEVMEPAIEIVVDNHVHIAAPIIIEGDGILPSLLARPMVHEHVESGHVRAIMLVEPDEATILGNMLARGRGIDGQTEAEARTEARAKWLFGQWLTDEARRRGLPVLEPRPWATLLDRIVAASGAIA